MPACLAQEELAHPIILHLSNVPELPANRIRPARRMPAEFLRGKRLQQLERGWLPELEPGPNDLRLRSHLSSGIESSKRVLGGAPTRVFRERKNEAIAVSHDKFALLVNAIFRTIQNVSTAPAQLFGQDINAVYVEVRVICPLGSVSFHLRFVGAAEEHLNLIARHNREDGRRVGSEACVITIPIAGDLEAENIAVILGRTQYAWHCGLGNDCLETNCRSGFSSHVLSIVPRAT